MLFRSYAPLNIAEMAITLYAAEKGYFDDVPVARALACEQAMHQYVKSKQPDLITKILTTKELDGDGEKLLASAIQEFKKSWS